MSIETAGVVHATFTIERHYPKPVSRVFHAFADAASKRRWFAEGEGLLLDEFTMDFRVGGLETSRFRMAADSPVPNAPIRNDSIYLDIAPDARIVIAYSMAIHGARMSCSLLTLGFEPERDGTRLTLTEQGAYFANSDGAAGREAGMGELLEALAAELGR